MNRCPSTRRNTSGFTLVELLVATTAVGAIGIVMFALLNVSMNLFARNVAVNLAHQQGRTGMDRVVRDLHQSVSIPQLVDANFAQINTSGPTAGITFQTVCNGPFNVATDPASSLIQISTPKANTQPPNAGDHMVVLDYNVETDIASVNPTSGNHWNVSLANSAEKQIKTKSGSFVVCYITRRVGYVVNGGELRYYANLVARPTTYAVVARNITSPTPFSVPLFSSTAGDVVLADGATTLASTTLMSASGAFGAGDIGKTIVAANLPSGTIITAINSGTSVTVSQAATATGTAKSLTIKARLAGAPDSRYTNVNLTVADPTYSHRNYAATKMEIADAHVPYHCQLTTYQ